ncbi:protein rep, partial [Burkholderia gladioli]
MQSVCAERTSTTLPSKDAEVKWETLAERSPSDKPWDLHRAANDRIARLYHTAEEFGRYAARMNECSGRLDFALTADADGVVGMKLKTAHFCRVRFCPVCQWRRSLMWKARFYKSLPDLVGAVPGGRWLFLTLTARNVSVGDLRSRLGEMSKAWNRMTGTKVFRDVEGWVRTV